MRAPLQPDRLERSCATLGALIASWSPTEGAGTPILS